MHGVERDCQVSHEATEPHAVDCVRVHLDACGLSEVMFKGDSEYAARVPVDEMEVERSEDAVVKESPKCSCQSSGEDRKPNTNSRSCVAREARSQS